ncbi:MAG: hypothetical protein Q4A15_02425 [Prevotellaceae bacterium]|nr:hypothetical protein [Prevotellaceae bacterium]
MKKYLYLLLALGLITACNFKKDKYDPYKINGKEKKMESKSSFEVNFKKTESNLKTIHIKLNNNGYDAIFDTGSSGMLISPLELIELMKTHTISDNDYIGVDNGSIADGSEIKIPIYNIKRVTVVDNNGKEHVLPDIQAAVVDNIAANILIGSSVIDNLAKKSYTVDLSKKVIRFE